MSDANEGAAPDKAEFDFPEPDNPMTVLTPTTVAPYCYLYEALLWVSVQRLPYSEPGEHCDRRIETQEFESADPPFEFEPIDDDECRRCGLPLNPEYAALLDGELYVGMTDLWQRFPDLPEAAEKLAIGRKFEAAVAAWDKTFNDYLDWHKGRLFIALREGKVPSFGKPMPPDADNDFPASYDDDGWHKWVSQAWEPIEALEWNSSRIHWEKCRLVGRSRTYSLIQVATDKLLGAFPPAPEPAGQAIRIGDAYQIVDRPMAARDTRGRRPFDWDSFHLEMAARLRSNTLPAKQEALVAEMQAWCQQTWGRAVARSTLVQKIAPYYAAFVRVS